MVGYSSKNQAAEPDSGSYSRNYLDVHRQIPRLESYERRRTLSDTDEQRQEPQNQRYQTPPLLNPRPRGYTDAYSTAATYGGDTTQGVRFHNNVAQEPIRSGGSLDSGRRASIYAGGYSNAVTYNGSPDTRTQRYVPSNPTVGPAAMSSQAQPPPFKKEAYCPR